MSDPFPAALAAIPAGYGDGTFEGARWGVTRTVSADGRREWLYGEALGGPGRVSCNVYRLGGGRVVLKPCEMPEAFVRAFVAGFIPREAGRAAEPPPAGAGGCRGGAGGSSRSRRS